MTNTIVDFSNSSNEIAYPLRRSNAYPCNCGICATCCDDFVFWNVVKTHRERIENIRHESIIRNLHNPQKYPLLPIESCKCMFCAHTIYDEVPSNLPWFPQPINTHIRRANNNECSCMVCATCVSDRVYFGVVEAHDSHDCNCLYCDNERKFEEKYKLYRS